MLHLAHLTGEITKVLGQHRSIGEIAKGLELAELSEFPNYMIYSFHDLGLAEIHLLPLYTGMILLPTQGYWEHLQSFRNIEYLTERPEQSSHSI